MSNERHLKMIRFYLRLGLILLSLLTGMLLLIHAQPYDDHELRALLLPEDCPIPCFMGIRPGETTREEAIRLLKASDQIEIKSSNGPDTNLGAPMSFSWLKNKPRLIAESSQLTIVFQSSDPNRVIQISFRLQREVTLGDFYLAFGMPSRYLGSITDASNSTTHRYQVRLLYLYDKYHISFVTISDCPLKWMLLLQQPVSRIEYDARMRMDGTKPMGHLG